MRILNKKTPTFPTRLLSGYPVWPIAKLWGDVRDQHNLYMQIKRVGSRAARGTQGRRGRPRWKQVGLLLLSVRGLIILRFLGLANQFYLT